MSGAGEGSAAGQDLDRLLDVLVQLSVDFLGKRGAFVPHAATFDNAGELRFGMAEAGDDATEVEHLELLRASLRQEAARGEIRACGIAVDVTIEDEEGNDADAIRVELDHRDEEAVVVIVPYERGERGYAVGEPAAYLSDEPVFSPG
ncbi:MAG: hypothetical protein AB1416_04330 [Actinomycetota bacterium]